MFYQEPELLGLIGFEFHTLRQNFLKKISNYSFFVLASQDPLVSIAPSGWNEVPRTGHFHWVLGISQTHVPKQIEEERGTGGETKGALPS